MDHIVISAPSRLHVTLCDLGRATFRAYGGVGFALFEPRLETCVTVGRGSVVLPDGTDAAALAAVTALIRKLEDRTGGPSIDVAVQRMPHQHSGLGTKTALLLSVLHGANQLLSLGLSEHEMQLASGRGGTSGVGVHAFFTGGLIWDGGHPQRAVEQFGPSRIHKPSTIPPCLARLEMPPTWRICLLEVEGERIAGDDEVTIFSRTTPIPVDETLQVVGCVVHGLLPAVVEQDLRTFGLALEAITTTGFKAREVAEQSADVQNLLSDLQAQSIPAGMSSLGPTIFALAHAEDPVAHALIESIGTRRGANCTWTHADNSGAILSFA